MSDAALIAAFEAGRVPPGQLRHRDHLRLAWAYLQRHGPERTAALLEAGLRAFARRAGRPDKFSAPLTRAWISAVDEARRAAGARTFDELIAARPDLLDPGAVTVA